MTESPELFWLTASVALTGVLWVPYILNRMREHGVVAALHNPNHDERPAAAWADRLMWAHANAVENLVLFAPLALAVHLLDASTAWTAGACGLYFGARVVHALVYTAGVPFVRTLAFLAGFGAQAMLVVSILGGL